MMFNIFRPYFIIISIAVIVIFIAMVQIKINHLKSKYLACESNLSKETLKIQLIEDQYKKDLSSLEKRKEVVKKNQKKNLNEIDKIMKENISNDCNKSIQYGIEKAILMKGE